MKKKMMLLLLCLWRRSVEGAKVHEWIGLKVWERKKKKNQPRWGKKRHEVWQQMERNDKGHHDRQNKPRRRMRRVEQEREQEEREQEQRDEGPGCCRLWLGAGNACRPA